MKIKYFAWAVAATMIVAGSLTVVVPSAVGALTIAPDTLATATAHIGEPYLGALSFEDGAAWSVTSGQLPPGLSLIAGQITGVPTEGGAYTFTVRAIGSSTAQKTYTILVNLPTSTGYDSRMHQVLVARDAKPPAGECNNTSYTTYAMADLWRNRNPIDVNNKLASLKFSHFGDPSACSPHSDQARNNLKLAYLVRAYMLYNSTSSYFPGRLTPAAANNLVAQMWTYASKFSKYRDAADSWSIYDSENHDAAAKGFYFMAAQIFNDTPAYRNKVYADHKTVAQQYRAWHDHWSDYLDQRAKRGLFIEVASPIYHQYTIEAILNIYNFADDPMLRKKAGMVLDLDFADYAQQQLNGIWGGAKSRSYPTDSFDGTADGMTNVGNLLWSSSPDISGDLNAALMFATSGYSPPPVVQTIATNHAALGSFAYISRRPGAGPRGYDNNGDQHPSPLQSVLNYAYVTPDYVLGTTELYPGQTEIAPSAQNRWEGITFNSGGGARIYPQTTPLGLSHTYDAFRSIQHKNVLLTAKQADIGGATLVYFPSTLTALKARGGWLFARQGPSYVAVRPAVGTYHWLTGKKNKAPKRIQRFISLSMPGSTIIFDAGREATDGSFSAFQNRILHHALTRTATAVTYTGSDRTKLTMYSDPELAPRINGHPLAYAPHLGFNSPFMRSVWGSGKITIKFGSQSASYDFSKRAAPRKVVK